jgi:hypothetical protein
MKNNAKKAVQVLRVWFIDEATKNELNMNYGQPFQE